MAIGETMSNYSNWMQLYQTNFTTTQVETPPTAPAMAAEAAATYSSTTSNSRNNDQLVPDQGRISKPIRRRSRASRKTPTTLLNTDITNFRAMVQHFTGGASSTTQLSGGDVSFSTQQAPGGGAQAGGFYVQYPNQLQHAFQRSVNGRRGGGRSGGAPSHTPLETGSSSMNDDGDHDNYML